jgi:hypothetical protein
MAFSDANSVTIRYARESAWGETPSNPASTQLRVTSESFSHNKETIVSNEIDSGRQRTALLEVADSAGGGFGFELSYATYEGFLEDALRGTIASATVAMTSTVVVAASSITGPSGTDFVASFAVGQWVKLKTSDEMAKISARTSTILTIVGTSLTASSYASAAVTGRTLVNSTTKVSYFIETDFGNIAAVKYQNGMRCNTANITVAAQQIVTGTFEFVGKQGFVASTTVASTVVTSTNTNTPLTAAANVVKTLHNDSSLLSAINSFTVDINNNMAPRPTVGSKFSSEPVDGGLDVTGNLNIFFDRIDFYQDLINHTSFSLDYMMRDDNGNAVIISLPEIKGTTGDPLAGGKDEDVFLSLDYQAVKDPTLGYTIRIDFLPT